MYISGFRRRPRAFVTPPRRVRRRIGVGVGAAAIRRRAFRRVARTLPYVGTAYTAYEIYRSLKNKRRVRRMIGERVGTATAKREENIQTSPATLVAQSLNSTPLITLTRTSTDALNGRERDISNVRGVKICFYIKNEIAKGTPICFNWAIVSPKDRDSVTAIPITDFFRSNGTTRVVNFTNALNWMELHCNPINSDKYHVYTHKRIKIPGVFNALDAAPTTTNSVENIGMGGRKLIEQYIPIKRQMRFRPTSAIPETNMYLVWWATMYGEETLGNIGKTQYRIITYFKEPKN